MGGKNTIFKFDFGFYPKTGIRIHSIEGYKTKPKNHWMIDFPIFQVFDASSVQNVVPLSSIDQVARS